MREQGDNFPNWVLDQLGIETELANRVALGRGLQPPRFRWVPFDDALLFPLKTSDLAHETPDRKFFFQRESMLLRRYMKDVERDVLPPTLLEYTTKIVTPVLELQKKNGAVAIKFEAAYLRSLDFGIAEPMEAVQQIYAHFVKGDVPLKPDYTRLQNYLFRYTAREAGRLGLRDSLPAVQSCDVLTGLAAAFLTLSLFVAGRALWAARHPGRDVVRDDRSALRPHNSH
jgi:hypothetical protein